MNIVSQGLGVETLGGVYTLWVNTLFYRGSHPECLKCKVLARVDTVPFLSLALVSMKFSVSLGSPLCKEKQLLIPASLPVMASCSYVDLWFTVLPSIAGWMTTKSLSSASSSVDILCEEFNVS